MQTREAQAVLKRLREEKQEEERAAEEARQAEEEARLRAAEAVRLEEARLAAESPETKQCRLLFAEIVRRNRSQLCPCPSPLLLPLSRLTTGRRRMRTEVVRWIVRRSASLRSGWGSG